MEEIAKIDVQQLKSYVIADNNPLTLYPVSYRFIPGYSQGNPQQYQFKNTQVFNNTSKGYFDSRKNSHLSLVTHSKHEKPKRLNHFYHSKHQHKDKCQRKTSQSILTLRQIKQAQIRHKMNSTPKLQNQKWIDYSSTMSTNQIGQKQIKPIELVELGGTTTKKQNIKDLYKQIDIYRFMQIGGPSKFRPQT